MHCGDLWWQRKPVVVRWFYLFLIRHFFLLQKLVIESRQGKNTPNQPIVSWWAWHWWYRQIYSSIWLKIFFFKYSSKVLFAVCSILMFHFVLTLSYISQQNETKEKKIIINSLTHTHWIEMNETRLMNECMSFGFDYYYWMCPRSLSAQRAISLSVLLHEREKRRFWDSYILRRYFNWK